MQYPFGYYIGLDGRYARDPNEHPAVAYALRLRRERYTLREIAEALNNANYTNRAGGRFNATQIQRMIEHEARWDDS